jgi:3-hydroxyacyl-[acyl-carrier-protein] dehydratase
VSAHPIAAVLAGTPHRHPMLLLDAIDSLQPGCRGTARKAVTSGEHAGVGAQGFAPTLLVDALGQLAIAVLRAGGGGAHDVWYLGSIEEMAFGAPARAGDVIRMEASVQRSFRGSTRVSVLARVDGLPIAQGFMVLSTGARQGKRGE